ncbi:MAG: hypothetical protein FWD91_00110 [Treponema sp.]|nr:hypothetical protein [Treponema sp.]
MDMQFEITSLKLFSPLYYSSDGATDPFSYSEGDGEKLFCFELEETAAGTFQPDRATFPGSLLFCGKAADSSAAGGNAGDSELPAGNYLFAQKREVLSRESIITMAMEIQQEGLWQRQPLGRKLYLRYLFEDGCPVTQLFRSCN